MLAPEREAMNSNLVLLFNYNELNETDDFIGLFNSEYSAFVHAKRNPGGIYSTKEVCIDDSNDKVTVDKKEIVLKDHGTIDLTTALSVRKNNFTSCYVKDPVKKYTITIAKVSGTSISSTMLTKEPGIKILK